MDGQTPRDRVQELATAVIGGPRGRYAADPEGFSKIVLNPAVALGLVGTLMMALAVLLRDHCRGTNWGSPGQFIYACYSDIPVLVSTLGMTDAKAPLVGGPTPGVGIGASSILWVLAQISPSGDTHLRWVFDLGAVLLTIALVALIVAVTKWLPMCPWRATLVAFSPVLLAIALVSLDLLGVAIAMWSLLLWRASRFLAAGAALGVAILITPVMWVVVLAVTLVTIRAGQRTNAAVFGLAATACFGVIQALFASLNPVGFRSSWEAILTPGAGYGGLWFVPSLGGQGVPAQVVSVGWLVLAAALTVSVFVWVFLSRTAVPVESVITVLLVGWFLVAPTNPVQAGIWLLPFAVLAVRQWAFLLPWFAAEVLHATLTWQYIYASTEPNKGAPAWFYALALLLRLGTLLIVAVGAWLRSEQIPAQLPESGSDRLAADSENEPAVPAGAAVPE